VRTTFRTFSWEWGPPLSLPLSLVMGLMMVSLPEPIPAACALAVTSYVAYVVWLVRRYPRRGDLPEWREYEALRNKDGRRNSQQPP
jgi:hypothetical protein